MEITNTQLNTLCANLTMLNNNSEELLAAIDDLGCLHRRQFELIERCIDVMATIAKQAKTASCVSLAVVCNLRPGPPKQEGGAISSPLPEPQ